MPKITSKPTDSELQSEYDFSHGTRGKYARQYALGTNLVLLEPDVAKAFPNARTVNSSLRALARIIRQHGEAK